MTHYATTSQRPLVFEQEAVAHVTLEFEFHEEEPEQQIRNRYRVPASATFMRKVPDPNPQHVAIYKFRWWVVQSETPITPMTDADAARWRLRT